METAALSERVRFGAFEFDTCTRELYKHELKLKLQGQPVEVLALLLARPGELVTREEIQKKLWPADTFVDFERGLNSAINRLREALCDSADTPRYIETLPRRGYRFIGAIETEREVQAVPGPSPASLNRRSMTNAMALSLVALAVVAALLAFDVGGLRRRLLGRLSDPPIRSLAVLPLSNLSGDSQQDYFADGMTDALITDMAKIQSLRVISRTSVMQFKDSKKPLPEIARALGVDGIVEGTVQMRGDRIHVTAQLIAVKNQAHLWAGSYDRDRSDVLQAQAEIARAVAQQIKVTLTPQWQQQLSGARRVNPDAYLDYLRGVVEGQDFTFEAMAREQAYYERALQKDPNFALAYAGLANCYLSYMITRKMPPGEAAKRTKELVGKALQLDANLGEAYGILAYTNWRFDWDVQAADRNFQRALELSQNSRRVHSHHITYLAWRGQPAQALVEAAIARQLDPMRLESAVHPGHVYFQTRDFGPMLEAMRNYVASNPRHWLGRNLLGVAYQGSGQTLLAIPEYQKAVEYSGNDSDPTAALAYAYARTG
ncbi:MAG TPA: winged helix-turn-helix domain-containing protein, partial [Candidatus Methylomirabilis sp.]|nr:winged helix-turn-helix domain-containing protein [Candidatus Methylomirabilis sp.]